MHGKIIQLSDHPHCCKVHPEDIELAGTDMDYVQRFDFTEEQRDKFCQYFANLTDGVLTYEKGVFTYHGGAMRLLEDCLEKIVETARDESFSVPHRYYRVRTEAVNPLCEGLWFIEDSDDYITGQMSLLEDLDGKPEGLELYVIDILDYHE
jgi:hypothetical protein